MFLLCIGIARELLQPRFFLALLVGAQRLVIVSNGACSDTATVVVNVTSGPAPFAGLDTNIIIGQTVNVTATMGRSDFALSQQAFRCLTPEHRRLFRRFTPPILYLPAKMEV